MIERVIEWSASKPLAVLAITVALIALAVHSVRRTPLDALPDLSDPQVIVFTEWMGRSPDLVEDQITYPLVRALRATPGGVQVVRGYSMFGMSFVYVVFREDVDLYWARTRVSEILPRVALPPDVTPQLGPDATGVGWVYEYVLEDTSGRLDLAELRALQDFTIGPTLQAVDGVAEVATIGGFERQFQVIVDPERLASFGVSVGDVSRAVADANSEVGARVLEMAGLLLWSVPVRVCWTIAGASASARLSPTATAPMATTTRRSGRNAGSGRRAIWTLFPRLLPGRWPRPGCPPPISTISSCPVPFRAWLRRLRRGPGWRMRVVPLRLPKPAAIPARRIRC